MSVSRYSCLLLGENHAEVKRLHTSSVRRLQAWSLSLHIPIVLWAGTSFLLSREIFEAPTPVALCVMGVCVALIYCLERLILAAPKSMGLAVMRGLIGLLTAILGACTVDLFVFDKEITSELYSQASLMQKTEHERLVRVQRSEIERARAQWNEARTTAACEGNGTCGSGVRSAGPLYRELLAHAAKLRSDLDRAIAKLDQMEASHAHQQATLTPASVKVEAGLLNRLHALHTFVWRDPMALGLWVTFFLFVLLLELSVVFAKFAFRDTVDDLIARCQEAALEHQANGYLDAVRSPLTEAKLRLGVVYQ